MNRGEVSNSTKVLSRLISSGEMFVFLRDFAGVFSRLAGSGETTEMKLYSENIKLASQTTLPDLKHCDYV